MESSNSIKELSNQNTKLDKLVQQLDSTIYSYSQLEGELRTRIIASEDYAIQKEIEVKQLESDFYDVLYRRSAWRWFEKLFLWTGSSYTAI